MIKHGDKMTWWQKESTEWIENNIKKLKDQETDWEQPSLVLEDQRWLWDMEEFLKETIECSKCKARCYDIKVNKNGMCCECNDDNTYDRDWCCVAYYRGCKP